MKIVKSGNMPRLSYLVKNGSISDSSTSGEGSSSASSTPLLKKKSAVKSQTTCAGCKKRSRPKSEMKSVEYERIFINKSLRR